MSKKRIIPICLLSLASLAGCSMTANEPSEPLAFRNDAVWVTPAETDANLTYGSAYNSSYDSTYTSSATRKATLVYDVNASGIAPKGQLNTWAETIANELVLQNDSLRSDQPLAVATPVLTADFNQTNALAKQLQQGLMTAFHAHHFNVVDINVANAIRATKQGEFLLSRDWQQLPTDLPVAHVLVSTMELTREGIMYNGRIVDITNNRVVSSAQSFVAGATLSGYLLAPQKIEQRNGLLYRHAKAENGRYTVLGDQQ